MGMNHTLNTLSSPMKLCTHIQIKKTNILHSIILGPNNPPNCSKSRLNAFRNSSKLETTPVLISINKTRSVRLQLYLVVKEGNMN